MKNFSQDEEDSFTFILAPLIDVMLFILMFFMLSYSHSFSQDVSLPSSQTAEQNTDQMKFWVLDYTQKDGLFLDGKAISRKNLGQSLALSKSKPLILRADKTLSYQEVMNIMDIVKQSGVQKIYLATKS